jgi:Domain of unknown function (DUF151)
VTTVRIAHAEPRPGRQPDGGFRIHSFLVVLADDPGRRAIPIWLGGPDGHGLWRILDPSAGAGVPPWGEDLTVQLLHAADVPVTGVDIDELDDGVTAGPPGPRRGPAPTARIEFTGAAGPQRTMVVRLGYALAVAAGTGAPVRVSDAVMERLAVPVQGGDLLTPFLGDAPGPASARPEVEPRFEPRNLAFGDGLAGWEFGGSFRQEADESHWRDYSCTASGGTEGGSAILSSAVLEPYGFAGLAQTVFAEDYERRTAVFRGELRTQDVASQCGLQVLTGIPPGPISAPERLAVPLAGSHGWTRQEVTAEVPAGAGMIQFGVFLYGRGRAELRNAELTFGT